MKLFQIDININFASEVRMSELPQVVTAAFDNNPALYHILPNPVQLTDSVLIESVNSALVQAYGKLQQDDFYQVIFKNGSSKNLLTIKNGELAGFLTTTCVRKGKFSDVAGLEKVNDTLNLPILHSLINVMIYRSLRAELSYIAHIVTDIRNDQIVARQAVFERITDAIIDCYQCIPEAALDETLRSIQLTRIIKNSDDCFELYVQQREELKILLKKIPNCREVFYPAGTYQIDYTTESFDISSFFRSEIFTHPVFSLFERLTATKVCELLLSENYSEHNHLRLRRQLSKVANEIRNCLSEIFSKLDSATTRLENEANNPDISRREATELSEPLNRHKEGVTTLKNLLDEKLEQKLKGLDLLKQVAAKEEWSVYILNGALLVNDDSATNQ